MRSTRVPSLLSEIWQIEVFGVRTSGPPNNSFWGDFSINDREIHRCPGFEPVDLAGWYRWLTQQENVMGAAVGKGQAVKPKREPLCVRVSCGALSLSRSNDRGKPGILSPCCGDYVTVKRKTPFCCESDWRHFGGGPPQNGVKSGTNYFHVANDT
jgi:hypothetical protein